MTDRYLIALTPAEADKLRAFAYAAALNDDNYGRMFGAIYDKLGNAPHLTDTDMRVIHEALRKHAEEIAETQYIGWRARTAKFGRIVNAVRGLFDYRLIESGGEWW